MDFHKLDKIKVDKKYLPFLYLIFGFVVFGGVGINQLYLSNRTFETDKVNESPNISDGENQEKEGEVTGIQNEPDEKTESITPSTLKIKQATPTVKSEVKSQTDEKNSDNSNFRETKTIIEERIVVVVTASPIPTSTPTLIPTSPPTPTPDTRPLGFFHKRWK